MALPTAANLTLGDGVNPSAVVTFNATMIQALDYARQQNTQTVSGVTSPLYSDWKEYLINVGLKVVMPNAIQLFAQAQLGQTLILMAPPVPALTHAVAMSNITFAASGGAPSPTYSFTATGLPAGLTLDAASGVLSGTPTTPGVYSVTLTVVDQLTNTAITVIPIVVN